MRTLCAIMILSVLAACNQVNQSVEDAVILSKENWNKWQKKYWSLYHYEPFDPPAQLPQIRYCYDTQTGDVVCYMRPQPNLSARLVGYQGPPPDELLAVIQDAQMDIVEDRFIEGEITVVELEDPTEPAIMADDMGESPAQGAPQMLLDSF